MAINADVVSAECVCLQAPCICTEDPDGLPLPPMALGSSFPVGEMVIRAHV